MRLDEDSGGLACQFGFDVQVRAHERDQPFQQQCEFNARSCCGSPRTSDVSKVPAGKIWRQQREVAFQLAPRIFLPVVPECTHAENVLDVDSGAKSTNRAPPLTDARA